MKTLQPARIVRARLHAGLTQEDVAFRLRQRGINASGKQVHRWEKGQAPRPSVIAAIADVLGVTIDQLYGEDEDDEEADPLPVLERAIQALASHREYDLAAELQRQVADKLAMQRAMP